MFHKYANVVHLQLVQVGLMIQMIMQLIILKAKTKLRLQETILFCMPLIFFVTILQIL